MKWEKVSLRDYTTKIGSGVTPKGGASVYQDDGVALFRSQNIYNGSFFDKGLAFINEVIAEKMKSVEVLEGDVLLNITGDSVARCCYAPVDFLPGRVNQHVAIVRADKEKLHSKFLMYQLISPFMQNTMLSYAEGAGATRNALTKGIIEDLQINLPPLPTQRKIASILSAYDDLIENNLKRIKLLEEKAFLRYKQIVREEILIEKPILDICYITDGTHDSPKQQTEGFYLVTGKHLIGGFIDFSSAYYISETDHDKIQKRSKVDDGDLILSNIGTIGNVAIIEKQFDFSVKNVIIFKPNRIEFSRFLYCYLNSNEMQTRFQQESSGTSQRFISLKYCRDLKVGVPKEDILKEFYEEVSRLLKLKSLLNQQNSKLREARDILLPKLMNGQIEV